ncbi:MAG TPA: ATP-grasp domain-containing protein [Vicinamibacteria bacterium]|nr:ATP-grasp domain-containing protein [Vicinamibacteria bacterium]
MDSKKRVLVVFPTEWDVRQLAACSESWKSRYEVEFAQPSDEDCSWDFDVPSFIHRIVEEKRTVIDGVFSSSDYPGATTAAAIATRLGLPGPRPADVIRASHKYYSRIVQSESAPTETPWFALVDPRLPAGGPPGIRFPCFLKPVKGAFSVMSQKIDNASELEAFLARPAVIEFLSGYVFIFNRLVSELTDFEINGSFFLAEELLKGKQVTLEGFVTSSGLARLGIVDSVCHARTKSFVRFDYPTNLPRRVQERMWEVAESVIQGLGLVNTLFNVEFMYHAEQDRLSIVEVNPRMCGQFADLYEKVDGVNSYEVAVLLASGQSPSVPRREGAYRVAASFPLRIFEPSRVVRAPSVDEISAAESMFEKTLVWPECSTGDSLDDFESIEDGKSARYAIVNVGADSYDGLFARVDEVKNALDYRFEICPPRTRPRGSNSA